MITKIIQISDIHIKNLIRQDEYEVQLKKFVDDVDKIVSENGAENTRVVITGDLLHNKLDISGEGYLLASWFLSLLDSLCKTIVIAGNHDMNMANISRLDPISTIFSLHKFDQTYYLDRELGYSSGCIVDDNVVWCLFSTFDKFARPNIEETKLEYPDSEYRYVGLYHGEVKGASTDTGYKSEKSTDSSYFDGIDFGLFGHIHKRQEIKYNGIPLLYSGSFIQQDHGENITGHGYSIWDVENCTHDDIDVENDIMKYFTFHISSIDDIDEDKESVLNL